MHLRATTTNRGVKMRNAVVVFAALASLSLSSAAFAQTGPGNSTPGLDRYLANPGRQQATDVGAQCGSGAGSGAFGFFGKDNNLKGGANGPATGEANSSICGNRQGTPPEAN